MTSLLREFELVVAPRARSAGFEPMEKVQADDLEWVEYRKRDSTGTLLLCISHTASAHTVTAELWRPELLTAAVRSGAAERAIEQRLAWHYAPEDAHAGAGRDVAEVVAAWFVAPALDSGLA